MQKLNYRELKRNFLFFDFFPSIFYRFKINSTNILASKLIKQVKNNFIVIADSQSKGKGRFNRKWLSPCCKNLYFSMVLQKNYIINFNTLLFVTTNSILKTLLQYKKGFQIKWPNDIIFNNKKISGILIENIYSNNKIVSQIIGIGININFNFFRIRELQNSAISLKNILGKEISREKFFVKYIKNFIDEYNNKEYSFEYWKNNLAFLNKNIRFHYADKIITGKFISVKENGNIVLEDKNKNILEYSIGEILL